MDKLWYDKPAANWNEALPLGNGRIGAMIFGGTMVERLALNEDSLWYGGFRNRVNPNAKSALPKIRQLLREDRIKEAALLAEEAMTAVPDGERHYEPLCDLILQQLGDEVPTGIHGFRSMSGKDMTKLEKPTDQYRRELDIRQGISTVQYRIGEQRFFRECFISYPHQVLALSHQGLPCRVLLRRGPYLDKIQALDQRTLAITGQTGDGGVSWAAVCRCLGAGVQTAGNLMRCPAACDIYLAAATSFYEDDPLTSCIEKLDAAEAAGYDALRESHVKDAARHMIACTLELGGNQCELPTDERLRRYAEGNEDNGLEALLFTYGRYLLLSCSRPGSLPANLQGIWNESFRPPWDSKYTININTEMNYWPAEACNLSECHLPLLST